MVWSRKQHFFQWRTKLIFQLSVALRLQYVEDPQVVCLFSTRLTVFSIFTCITLAVSFFWIVQYRTMLSHVYATSNLIVLNVVPSSLLKFPRISNHFNMFLAIETSIYNTKFHSVFQNGFECHFGSVFCPLHQKCHWLLRCALCKLSN